MSIGLIATMLLAAGPLATISDAQLCDSFRRQRARWLAQAPTIDEHVKVTGLNVDCITKRLVYQLNVPLVAPDSFRYAEEYRTRMVFSLCSKPTQSMIDISKRGWKYRWNMNFIDKTSKDIEVECLK